MFSVAFSLIPCPNEHIHHNLVNITKSETILHIYIPILMAGISGKAKKWAVQILDIYIKLYSSKIATGRK